MKKTMILLLLGASLAPVNIIPARAADAAIPSVTEVPRWRYVRHVHKRVLPRVGCPDRYSCYPLYGAYGPYGGHAYWAAYSGW